MSWFVMRGRRAATATAAMTSDPGDGDPPSSQLQDLRLARACAIVPSATTKHKKTHCLYFSRKSPKITN